MQKGEEWNGVEGKREKIREEEETRLQKPDWVGGAEGNKGTKQSKTTSMHSAATKLLWDPFNSTY